MIFSKETMNKVAELGGKEVSRAFSKLAKEDVVVDTSVAEAMSYDFLIESFKGRHDKAVITYAQSIGGVDGVALLSMTRESALLLVDILSGHEIGSTGVMMDLDRSAIKETLNILSNSYLNYLAKNVEIEIMFGQPYMMTASNINDVVSSIKDKSIGDDENIFVFKTILSVAKHEVKAELYIFFSKNIVELINKIK